MEEQELLESIILNEYEVFKRLLSTVANVNCHRFDGNTPLHETIYRHRPAFTALLLENENIDVNIPNVFGTVPLHFAAQRGYKELAEALITKKAVIDIENKNGETPMARAVMNGHFELTKFFLDRGSNVNPIIKNDSTSGTCNVMPLHIAAMKGNIKMVGLLVSAGADTSAKLEGKYTYRELFLDSFPKKISEFDSAVEEAREAFEERIKSRIMSVDQDNAEVSSELDASIDSRNSVVSNHSQTYSSDQDGQNDNAMNPNDEECCSSSAEESNFEGPSYSQNTSNTTVAIFACNSDKEDSVANASSSSSDFPSGGDGIKMRSHSNAAEQPSDQQLSPELMEDLSDMSIPDNYVMQFADDRINDDSTANLLMVLLLMVLFSWIKDLSETLRQQVLTSFNMQQVLKLLEAITDPSKIVTAQLSSRSSEEKFEAERQKYYGQDELYKISEEADAKISQYDFSALVQDDGMIISSGGILIDPLSKENINFVMPCSFESLMS